MYKLLVIDDEYITRKGIIKQIDFRQYNINEIEEADDGVNALKIAKEFQPDIVISDIKMPRMDGVSFAFELKKILPTCRVIFMSGYTELDYYRNAIKLNAISYIEKPIDLEELKQSIKNAVDDLMQYANYKFMSKQVDELIKTNEEVLKSQLSTLLIEHKNNEELILNKAKEVDLELLPSNYYITLVIKQYTKGRLDPYDQGASKNRITAVLDQYLQPLPIHYVMHFKGNITIITLIAEREHRLVLNYDKLVIVYSEVYEKLQSICKPSIGLGKVVSSLKEIHDSYISAVITSERLFFKKGSQIDFYKSVKNEKIYIMEDKKYTSFNEFLEKSNKTECVLFIKHLTEEIRNYIDTPKNNIVDIYVRVFAILNQYMNSMGDMSNKRSTDVEWHDISTMITLDELERFIIQNIDQYFTLLQEQYEVGSIAIKVKQIIHANYDDFYLNVDGISEKLNVTNTYMSVVFKKEIGITINKYITKYRIEKAKDKLRDTSDKIELVANSVGYNDSDYFSKVFKRYVLCTPSEYRKKFLV